MNDDLSAAFLRCKDFLTSPGFVDVENASPECVADLLLIAREWARLHEISEGVRSMCERRDGGVAGSHHECKSCGRRFRWGELRWEIREYGNGPVVVGGIHKCDQKESRP